LIGEHKDCTTSGYWVQKRLRIDFGMCLMSGASLVDFGIRDWISTAEYETLFRRLR